MFFNVLICFSPSDQMMAAMPIVLNFDSRGLSGFIIALYLIVDSIEFIASLCTQNVENNK